MNLFDTAEEPDVGQEKAESSLSHLIGSKDEEVRFLPDLPKTAASAWTYMDSDERIDHLVSWHAVPEKKIKKKLGPSDASQDYADALDAFHDTGDPTGAHTRLRSAEIPHTHSSSKEARRDFSEREKMALIDEDGEAHNAHKVDVKGTHYETQTPSEIAMMIMPLKGL